MPHLPEGMIDAMEKLLRSKFFDAEVTAAVCICPEILKITFSADLNQIDFHTGWSVMIRIGAKDLRHYTISSFNRDTGLFDILFHIHGAGPGSDFVARLQIGEKLKMAVPGGGKMYVPDSSHHFFFGDETSLSFMLILIEKIRESGANYQGILELRAQNSLAPQKLNVALKTVLSTPDTPGFNAIKYLNELKRNADFSFEKYVFYLTGNVSSIQMFRKELKNIGVGSKKIKLQGYWVEGSVGL